MYLIQSDFSRAIQSENLSQISRNDPSVITKCALSAIQTATSYLTQKYITSQEFQDTQLWNPAVVYKATNRVYLDATAYNPTATYVLGALALQGGNIYRCNTAITAAEPFAPAHWDLLGAEFDMFSAAYPNLLFILTNVYRVGDIVFWGTGSWQCLIATVTETHSGDLQAVFSQQIPVGNSFPNAIGQNQWLAIAPIPYVVPSGTDILDTAYWTPGDSRNQELLDCVIDIALYRIHKGISPRNIPELRRDAYHDAIDWLVAAGDVGKSGITAALPLIQPKSGGRIRYGGNVRTYTGY